MSSAKIRLVAKIIGFHLEKFHFKCLDIFLSNSWSMGVLFDGNLRKIQASVTTWNTRFLFVGGKLILIKHVLNSIPIFLF